MAERSIPFGDERDKKSSTREELRTVAFRLREIQRLLSMRVEQENRRLEVEGIEPVRDTTFATKHGRDDTGVPARRTERHVRKIAALDLFSEMELGLDDGKTVEGRVTPIDYVPGRRLRFELQPTDRANVRYRVHSEHSEGGWDALTVRRYEIGDDEWSSVGVVARCRC